MNTTHDEIEARRLLDSAKAYLEWRVTSERRRFCSWRCQPQQVGDMMHAINILQRLIVAGPKPSDEHRQIMQELGEALEQAKRKVLPPKKPVQIERRSRRIARAA